MDDKNERMAQAKRKLLQRLKTPDKPSNISENGARILGGANASGGSAPRGGDGGDETHPGHGDEQVQVGSSAERVITRETVEGVDEAAVRNAKEGEASVAKGNVTGHAESKSLKAGGKGDKERGGGNVAAGLGQRGGRGAGSQRNTRGETGPSFVRRGDGRWGRGGRWGGNGFWREGSRGAFVGQRGRGGGERPGRVGYEGIHWEGREWGTPSEGWRGPRYQGNSDMPNWRMHNVEEEEKNRKMVDKLVALKKDMDSSVERFQNGGPGGRMGMSRLQGDERNQWAFLDESDVSDFAERVAEPAMTFKFELDDFQKRAILQVEQQNSVFVAAHTSAGKTVIAEYAIALAAAYGSKVFYTSPIKTLSNQKLRDFREKFGDVGLVTGDVSIDDDAQCVIMTTEILRSMLYRGADVIRDVTCVIFDEVQFLNDEERGVVWEESIIMLPPHVVIIMLSATVPNALEFASWVGKTKDRKVAVVSTTKRPVPLEHSWLYHQKGTPDKLAETVLLKQGGPFLSTNYRKAVQAGAGAQKAQGSNRRSGKKSEAQSGKNRGNRAEDEAEKKDANGLGKDATDAVSVKKSDLKGVNRNKGPSSKKEVAAAVKEGRGPNSPRSPWAPLVRFLDEKNCTPSVVFCFSKKKCEKAVESLENRDLLPDTGQKAYVHRFFEEAIVRLREEDRSLPQVLRVRNNLMRGFAAHHAGLLPLIKEITEILFAKGFVKVLFATETFAMGVNMPARTVVFAALRKHDGRRFRYLEAGEYTQMSGRAGRRGHDKVGNVYLFFPPEERIPDERSIARIMTGRPISLRSAFRLTYNMILNVLRVDELRVEEVMKQSFSEAWGNTKTQGITDMLDKASETLSTLNISGIDSASSASSTSAEGTNVNESVTLENALPIYAAKFSQLSEASSDLTFREINPVFRDTVRPGRVVVAEVKHGFLSLCVVFSIVPPPRRRAGGLQNQPSASQLVVRHESLLWVACLSGVRSNAAGKHMSSILLLPESRSSPRSLTDPADPPQVVSSDGLVVVLQMINASKIVYVCDDCEQLPANRIEAQAVASRVWHFGKNSFAARKTLPANAAFLQKVVAKWRRNSEKGENVSNMERFLRELAVSTSRVDDAGEEHIGGNVSKNSRQRRFVPEVPEAYTRRLRICLDLITDTKLAECVIQGGGKDLLSDAARLILERSVRAKMRTLKKIQDVGSQPVLLPEYHQRVEVLQALNYVGSDGLSVQLKGRCACEVATVDSVVLTEIIVENVLQNLEPAEVASLLSSLVCRKKNVSGIHNGDEKRYRGEYLDAKRAMREVVETFGKTQEEAGVELEFEIGDGEDYEGSICRWDLAHAVYEWARGEAFFSITDLTEQQEGDIVVCVKRLIELLKDAQAVAKLVENMELLGVLEKAVESIRRDVVFNGSLYYDRPTTGEVVMEEDSDEYEY